MDVNARYQFAEIPNTEDGKAFIAEMKQYLNPRYKLIVRGQHLAEGEDWRRYTFGAPISKSKCLRVYIDEK
jgi:hypothetical protein